jgi:hypothetical protein
MSEQALAAMIPFLEDALEREFIFGTECLKLRREAFKEDPPQWDIRTNLLRRRELAMKHLWIPRLPNATLRPAFDIKRALWDEERLNKQADVFRKSVCFKVSIYESSLYDYAAICLLSNNSDSRLNEIDRRFDLVQHDGKLKLANTSQDMCAKCRGASALTEQNCTCEFSGYITPATNDIGLMGSPLTIKRLEPGPTGSRELYDAEC